MFVAVVVEGEAVEEVEAAVVAVAGKCWYMAWAKVEMEARECTADRDLCCITIFAGYQWVDVVLLVQRKGYPEEPMEEADSRAFPTAHQRIVAATTHRTRSNYEQKRRTSLSKALGIY